MVEEADQGTATSYTRSEHKRYQCQAGGEEMVKYCEICRAETDGAPLCDRCARKLRNDCRLVHLAIAARAGVGSGTINNLREDERRLAEYDKWKEETDA